MAMSPCGRPRCTFVDSSVHPTARGGIATSRHLGFRLAGILKVGAAVKRQITLSDRQNI
jgi:hypothetical protein